ncbi:hypothetical protein FisN_23Lh012 [Fistulifera solaris]|uniref:Uncharacterized protein n=1 Tax=Fistulifera solaris TaxID=1519565 RepID=A0A1Z5KJW1_FISSO|nr:hypothetical protein FisN_23Lh012 [Fistulifera solaris]|eukprot:GAX26487.1 hypothetical protein FisN_23Lh012 [Fistulifera solaris]
MRVSSLRFVLTVLLALPFTGYAWILQRTTPRQRVLFNGSTIQRSSNPRLSGELLPQGIVDSSTVYRGGLIEKPQWNGAPAEGFREAPSIQNMYYSLSTLPEKETEDERDTVEANRLSVSKENNILDDGNEVLSDTSKLDHTDSLSEKTIEAALRDHSFATETTNDQSLSDSDVFLIKDEDDSLENKFDGHQGNEAILTEESTEKDEFFYEDSLKFMKASFEDTEGDLSAIEDRQDHFVARTEEMEETEEDRGNDESFSTPDESEAIDARLEDGALQLLSLQAMADNELDDELPTSIEEENAITSAESDLLTEVEDVDGTFQEEIVEDLGAAPTEDAKEHVTLNGSHDAIVESSTNELTQPELSAEPMILGNHVFEQREPALDQNEQPDEETTTLSLNVDVHHESDLTSSKFFGEKQQRAESRPISGASAMSIIESSTIMQSLDFCQRPLKRIPLFQKLNVDADKESAFLRVVRRYTEADKRRRKLIEERRMAESINGLEDVDALDDLFKKLTSVGIIPRVKMYGKRVTLDDGTTAMGKRRKLCIELEWEMD